MVFEELNGSVWTYLSFQLQKSKKETEKYANSKRIWRISDF